MDHATHEKSFNRHFRKPQPLRTLAEYEVLVSHRLLRDKLSVGRDFSSKQIVVTVSQESAARLGAGFNGQAPSRMARLVWWMPSAIGLADFQTKCDTFSKVGNGNTCCFLIRPGRGLQL